MLERIRRYRFCGSDMTDSRSALSYRENPFCDECFDHRVKMAGSLRGPFDVVRDGDYLVAKPRLLLTYQAGEVKEGKI